MFSLNASPPVMVTCAWAYLHLGKRRLEELVRLGICGCKVCRCAQLCSAASCTGYLAAAPHPTLSSPPPLRGLLTSDALFKGAGPPSRVWRPGLLEFWAFTRNLRSCRCSRLRESGLRLSLWCAGLVSTQNSADPSLWCTTRPPACAGHSRTIIGIERTRKPPASQQQQQQQQQAHKRAATCGPSEGPGDQGDSKEGSRAQGLALRGGPPAFDAGRYMYTLLVLDPGIPTPRLIGALRLVWDMGGYCSHLLRCP